MTSTTSGEYLKLSTFSPAEIQFCSTPKIVIEGYHCAGAILNLSEVSHGRDTRGAIVEIYMQPD